RAQAQATAREIGDQRCNNFTSRPLGGHKVGACGFCRSPKFSPKIQVPVEGQVNAMTAGLDRWQDFLLCRALICGRGPTCNLRKLIGAGDSQPRLGLKNPRCRDAHIVILLQRSLDQLLQFFIAENRPPLLITKGVDIVSSRFFWRQSTISWGSIDFRPFVIRPDSAAADETCKQKKSHSLSHVSHLLSTDSLRAVE